jgi:DNA-binding IclR family transcriptional regulator
MLAYLDDDELDGIFPDEDLPVITPKTTSKKAQLRKSLSQIRKQNYAYDNEESALGVWAVASCIRDDTGRPIAALSIVGPASRIAAKDNSLWYQLVRNGAAEISSSLGYFEE